MLFRISEFSLGRRRQHTITSWHRLVVAIAQVRYDYGIPARLKRLGSGLSRWQAERLACRRGVSCLDFSPLSRPSAVNCQILFLPL